ncbi:hypothetical protein BDR03DRAFT_984025 [Suillus americanus]|nr:hypothetical protein BDR03DRAFT_984025 [Suillus americanus]
MYSVQKDLASPGSKPKEAPTLTVMTKMISTIVALPRCRRHARFSQVLFSFTFGGVPFVRATYHQNPKAWLETEPTILEMHKKAGRTQDGLWSNYLAARRRALGEVSKKHSRRTWPMTEVEGEKGGVGALKAHLLNDLGSAVTIGPVKQRLPMLIENH